MSVGVAVRGGVPRLMEGDRMAGDGSELVRMREAAAIVGVHPQTLRDWEAKGLIESVRLPGTYRRFRVSDLRALKAAQS